MKILTDTPIGRDIATSVALGNFDGVHRGHQLLLFHTKQLASKLGAIPAVGTFKPHPDRFYGSRIPLICTLEQKIALIKRYNIDACFIITFNKKFSSLTPEQFVDEYIVSMMNAKAVVVGNDFGFAQNRSGNTSILKELCEKKGIVCKVVDRLEFEDKPISSTRIRELLQTGNVESIPELLGRYISFAGIVGHGDKIGSGIGYPTANLELGNELLPPDGVYAGYTVINNAVLPVMAYLGTRPTVTDSINRRFEVNIIDYDAGQDLYDKPLGVYLTNRIRGDQKFDSLDSLKTQLNKDKENALSFFHENIQNVIKNEKNM